MELVKEQVSFGLGIVSLMCWGVAEIPQIVTNWKKKSAEGVSLGFISTWIAGDVFNLIGCLLEPATLPTQYYTALLYTSTTIVLALQCLYYSHFLRLRPWRPYHFRPNEDNDEEIMSGRLTRKIDDGRRRKTSKPNLPIEMPHDDHKDFHFLSARSLAGSDSYGSRCTSYIILPDDSSDENEATSPSSSSFPKPLSLPRPIPPRPAVGYGTFVAAAAAYLPHVTRASHLTFAVGRRLTQRFDATSYGQCLGWLMAAIYTGSRLPQIWLNIKRGSVEGLNPLMFIFALIANATYVGSILVRSTEWDKIKPNMPWLLDALVCVALDLFFGQIIAQYIFYRFMKRNKFGQSDLDHTLNNTTHLLPQNHKTYAFY